MIGQAILHYRTTDKLGAWLWFIKPEDSRLHGFVALKFLLTKLHMMPRL
jgi:hypothetical protein